MTDTEMAAALHAHANELAQIDAALDAAKRAVAGIPDVGDTRAQKIAALTIALMTQAAGIEAQSRFVAAQAETIRELTAAPSAQAAAPSPQMPLPGLHPHGWGAAPVDEAAPHQDDEPRRGGW